MTVCPKVTVIMPAYNAEEHIRESLESVLSQSFGDFELLVIDDHSSDGTQEIVEELARHDSRIILKSLGENRGVSQARNVGIELASGEWIALLDSDDLWERQKLEIQLKRAFDCGSGFVYCSYDLMDKDGKALGRIVNVPESIDFNEMLKTNWIGCSCVLVRQNILKLNPFPIGYGHEDYFLWMLLLRNGIKMVGCKEVLMHYRRAPGTQSSDKLRAAKNRWRIYRKGLGLDFSTSLVSFAKYASTSLHKHVF